MGDLEIPKVKSKICVVMINKVSNTETFIKAHIQHLPFEKLVLYGASQRLFFAVDDKPILDEGHLFKRALLKLERLMKSLTYEQQLEEALVGLLRKKKIGVVLAEYGTTGVHVVNACKKANCSLVAHFHGFDASSSSIVEKYRKGYQQLFNHSKAIIAVSKSMREKLIGMGAEPSKVKYLCYGVDVERFRQTSPSKNSPTFIHVGRFVNMKAPYLTLIAFRKVVDVCPEAKLTMVGNNGVGDAFNSIHEACVDLCEALELSNSVDFKGNLDHEQVAGLLATSRAFVLHSLTTSQGNAEGTPNAVLEAMASGLPIVATRHAGIMDVIEHGEDGFLVAERDVTAMADYMLKLVQNPEIANEMGRKARKKIENCYTIAQSIAQLAKIIES